MSILKKSICLIIFAFLFGFFSEYAMEEKEPENKKRKIEEEAEVSHKKQKTSEPLSEEQSKKIFLNLLKGMLEATKKGDVEWIKNFIEHEKRTILFLNIINAEIIDTPLDDNNNNTNNNNNTFLLIALKKNQFEIARLLIDNDFLTPATIDFQDEYGKTALMVAVDMNNPELAKLMIEKGADLDLQNKNGRRTALMVAIIKKEYEIAKLMIEKGAALDLQDKNGNTALMIAIDRNNPELAEQMIEKGANLDLQEKHGYSALMLAIMRNLHGVAELLIEKGAKLDLQNNDGRTALMFALGRKQNKTARRMIEKGANLDLQDKNGITALKLADYTTQIEISKLIKEVMGYKDRISNGKDDALYNAITQKNKKYNFSASEWLTLALIGQNEEQIHYCINKKLFTKEEVEAQKLYLKLRSKSSKELLKLVENKTYTPLDILRALSVQPEDIMPIDVNIAANLLEYTTPEERTSIMKLAQKHDNKKLGKKIIDFNNNIRLFTNKKNRPLPEELSKKIAAYA